MAEDHYIDPQKMSGSPYSGGSPFGLPPVPEMTMPSFRPINPRPFDPVGVPRNLAAVEATPTLYLIIGTAANKVQVTPGYVNQEMPSLSGTDLDDDPAPEITIAGATEVWIQVVGTFGTPDTYVVTIETTEPTYAISGTGFVSGRLLGTVVLDAGNAVITHVHEGGNLSVESFGSVNLWWEV